MNTEKEGIGKEGRACGVGEMNAGEYRNGIGLCAECGMWYMDENPEKGKNGGYVCPVCRKTQRRNEPPKMEGLEFVYDSVGYVRKKYGKKN